MSPHAITADLLIATSVISQLAAASLPQKCKAVEEIAELGLQVEQLTVRQLMDIALKAAPMRNGTASMVATSTAPQRREIQRLLDAAGIRSTTIDGELSAYLTEARVLMPQGIAITQALRGISYVGAARLIRAIRNANATEGVAS